MSKGFANRRVVLLASLIFCSFAGLGTRLVWLQVLHRDQLLDAVDKARHEIIVQSARRGDITDVNGNLLATSRSVFKVGVDPRSLRPQDEKKWPQLAALLGRPLAEVSQILTTRFRPAAAPGRPSEGVGQAARAVPARLASLVFYLPGAVAAAAPSAPPTAAEESAEIDETVVDEPDAHGDQPIKYAKLNDSVPEDAYRQIQALGIEGIVGERAYRRDYPDNELAAHVLGYVNHDEKPAAGIEAYADFYLRGQDGWIETEKDGRRQEMPQFRSRVVPAANGYSIRLSIDSYVQHVAEAEVAAIAAKYQPQKVTVIVSNPRTGFILALANYPSFNPNEYNRIPRAEQGALRNIAATDEYEPGSVFKIVAASGALNEGLVTKDTVFDCAIDRILYHGILRGLPGEDEGDHFTRLSVAQIIGRSSNRGAAQLGMMLGEERFYGYVRAFGFGQPTGFPVAGEIGGDVKPVRRWDSLTITRMPMGQSVGVTALQIHQAMGAIASGGVLLRPQVISQIRDADGNIVASFGRIEVRRVMSAQTARTMVTLLQRVATPKDGTANGGTGSKAAIPGYDVAGKTGTANKLEWVELASGKKVLRYSPKHHVASFVGFFPAAEPQVAISVIVDDADAHAVPGQYAGGAVAAPSFKNIGEQLISYLNIRPAPGTPVRPLLAMGGVRP
jgi:cell division protein FtsI (penicillin-binding protein 3)